VKDSKTKFTVPRVVYYLALLLTFSFILSFIDAAYAETAVDGRDEFAEGFLSNYVVSHLNSATGFPSEEANAVLQTSDGYMWFGGYNGLYRYDGSKYTIWDAASQDGFGSSNIRALYEDKSGVLWIGTNDNGLVAYQDGKFTVYNKSHGLPSNIIRSITEGDNGLYCATPEGIFIIDAERNITLIKLHTDIQNAVISICSDENNNIFAAFNNGELFVYTSDGQTVRFDSESAIYAVGSVSGGRVIAGTREGDIFILHFDGRDFTRRDLISTPLSVIDSFYEDSNGFIWIAGQAGIGFLDKEEVYRNAGNPNGVGYYSDICEDYQNGYWITATNGGIIKLTVSAFTDFNALNNFESGAANAILMDNGNTYIGANNGLYILDSAKKPILTDFTDTINTRVRGIFKDSQGNIWICTYSQDGVIRYNPAANSYRSFTPDDGLVSDRTRVIQELPSGVIAVGTAMDIIIISKAKIFRWKRESSPPPTPMMPCLPTVLTERQCKKRIF